MTDHSACTIALTFGMTVATVSRAPFAFAREMAAGSAFAQELGSRVSTGTIMLLNMGAASIRRDADR